MTDGHADTELLTHLKTEKCMERAWQMVVELFVRRLYGYFRKRFPVVDAEDLTQTTLYRLFKYINKHGASAIGSLRSYVFSIARTVMFDFLESKRNHHQVCGGIRGL